MKKALRLILILLLIIAILITGSWFMARNKAVKEGREALSFRDFIGLGTKGTPENDETPLTPEEQAGGGGSSGGDTTGAQEGDGGDTLYNDGNVTVSEFTEGPLTPVDPIDPVTTPASFPTTGTGSTSTSTTVTPTTTPVPPPVIAPTATIPRCSDDDVTIAFTPEEIKRLNELQDRFYDVAQILHTDADVQAELANYDNFKVRTDKATDLYNYCTSKAPRITATPYASRIPTPFWRDASRDRNGYMSAAGNSIPLSTWNQPIDPRNLGNTQRFLQKVFALNLW